MAFFCWDSWVLFPESVYEVVEFSVYVVEFLFQPLLDAEVFVGVVSGCHGDGNEPVFKSFVVSAATREEQLFPSGFAESVEAHGDDGPD